MADIRSKSSQPFITVMGTVTVRDNGFFIDPGVSLLEKQIETLRATFDGKRVSVVITIDADAG